jgi:hypothetical protein
MDAPFVHPPLGSLLEPKISQIAEEFIGTCQQWTTKLTHEIWVFNLAMDDVAPVSWGALSANNSHFRLPFAINLRLSKSTEV